MILLRASSIGNIMAYPEKDTLADGAKTYLEKLASQYILDWRENLNTFEIEKGKVCEDISIDLYNLNQDTFYMKNTARISNDLMTGECDILDQEKSLVIDIKTAYSKKTFPMFLTASKLYEWQLRAYMHLYNVNQAELAYCLVDTPEDLRKKTDPQHWHEVSDVDLKYRVSTLRIARDEVKEQQLLNRLSLCSQYIKEELSKWQQ